MRLVSCPFVLAFVSGLACLSLAGRLPAQADDAALEFFEKEVRPILVKRCYECHSAEAKRLEGGLRLDSRALALKGGDTGPSLVPGKPKESLLIDAINYGETYQMPPKSKMPADEIAVLTKWVEQGAVWPKEEKLSGAGEGSGFDLAKRKASHWSWRPIQPPELPRVKQEAWIQQPLDRFILAQLEAQGFQPARPADAATLLRRLYFDLIGLPPTEAEVTAFVAASAKDRRAAIEQAIDQLLASPHFGERWGRHWLDLVRYAESRGHEFDYSAPNAYQYRDYVIRALNADVPYDQFVVEHIAGDLLEKPRLHPTEKFNESILGTGFWFLGEWVHSPVDIRKDETDRFDNMVDVFSKTFLGLTVACARCHDHKFDAISQQDYYALFGYLQSSSHRLTRFETLEEEKQLAAALAKLESEYRLRFAKAITKASRPVLSKLGAYYTAAAEVIRGGDAAKIAAEHALEGVVLEAWVKRLRQAKEQPHDSLHLWGLLAAAKPEEQAKIVSSLRESWLKGRAGEGSGSFRVVVDYEHLQPGQWMSEGPSFGVGPTRAGQLLLGTQPDQPILGVATYAAARRDPTWNGLKAGAGSEIEAGRLGFLRAGKTLKTPTFDVGGGLVHCLVKGAATVYAAVDSHSVINGPLHGQLVKETGGDANAPLRWFTLDLKTYVGHRAHLEFTPKDDLPFELVRVVVGDKPPPLPVNSAAGELLTAWQEETRQPGRVLEHLFATAFEQLCRSGISELPAFAQLAVSEPALFGATENPAFRAAVQEYFQARDAITKRIRRESRLALVMWDGTGEDDRLLIRGNVKTPGPVVPRRMLEAIAQDLDLKQDSGEGESGAGQGSGRLKLAQQLVDPRNPFVARVMVNRVWHHLMGRGIVPSNDNFGVLGQEPTHPGLLDWLARNFAEGEGLGTRDAGLESRTPAPGPRAPWSVKRLLKQILLSSSYQQSSDLADAATEERDPNNLTWRRQQVKRLEGEVIRDSLLAVSGRLDKTQFGPSVPIHLTGFLQGRGRPADGPLDGNGRRSVYLSVRRNFLSPMMLAFDTPIPFSTVGRRNVSNVPAQALILMNDPFVLEQMKLWAQRTLAEPSLTPQQRIARMYFSAYGRPPREDETSAALAFLSEQAREYGLPADSPPTDVRPWADLGHVLVNGKEFVFVR